MRSSRARPRAAPRRATRGQPSRGASSAKLSTWPNGARAAPNSRGRRAAAAGATAGSRSAQRGNGAMRAGVALASGWPEKGSVAGCTSAPMRPRELFSADQWIGTNRVPGCCPRLTSTRRMAAPCTVVDPRQRALLQAEARGVVGMDLHERLGDVARKPRRQAGARHGVPLVANAAGVEHERPVVGDGARRARGGAMATKRALRSGVKKPPSANRRSLAPCPARQRPLEGLEAVVGSLRRDRPPRRCRRRACRRSRSPTGARARRRSRPRSDRRRPRRSPAAAPPRSGSTSRAAPRRQAAGTRAGARCAARSW